jgi:hypothetical protein
MGDSGAVRTTGTTRRAVLRATALSVVPIGALAACTGGSATPPAPRPSADDLARAAVISQVDALVASYRAAVTALPRLVAVVGSLLAEHEAHLQALGPMPTTVPSPYVPGTPTPSDSPSSPAPTPSASSSPSAPVSGDPTLSASAVRVAATAAPPRPSAESLALEKLRALELAAAPRTAAQTVHASGPLARLIASIAACEAAHAAVLRARR